MNVVIERVSETTVQHINQIDAPFKVDSRLKLQINGDSIEFTVETIPEYIKRYSDEEDGIDDPSEYSGNADKVAYIAFVDEQLAGQILIRKSWNNYAYIENIKIAGDFRNRGIATKLLACAKAWAKELQLPGIALETQNNNVAACKLYHKNGFRIGGFDFNLYKGLKQDTKEIALYWYYLFD